MKRVAILLLLAALALAAHVGSPDVFLEGAAGPYRLLVTIRPPEVVPGVATIEIRSTSADVRTIHIVPLRLVAPNGQYSPVPDLAQPSAGDAQFFTGSLWLMATGSWQVRIDLDGARGPASLAVPVPALATRVIGIEKGLAFVLLPLGLLLFFGLVSIAGACAREAQLEPGTRPDSTRKRRARIAMLSVAAILAVVLYFGNLWWNSEDGFYRGRIYKPLQLKATLENRNRLVLRLEDPGWLNRSTTDLLPDHNHLMHLYVIRLPEMERVWHLHPERGADDDFVQQLPDMPAGRYALYGDVVHANGLAETATTELDLPGIAGTPLVGDDAGAVGPPISQADYNGLLTPLSGGYKMMWERASGTLHARRAYLFRFHVEDAAGQPAQDMELYMGMLGHVAFVRSDRTVFAHIHPSGSVPMPALALTLPGNPHAGHMGMTMTPQASLPAEVSFPYGFPRPGNYRLYVQVKRGGRIETGIFDAHVEN